jgi:hypothetical protein
MSMLADEPAGALILMSDPFIGIRRDLALQLRFFAGTFV